LYGTKGLFNFTVYRKEKASDFKVKTAIFLENQSIQPSNPVFSKLRTFALSCSVTPSAVAVGAVVSGDA